MYLFPSIEGLHILIREMRKAGRSRIQRYRAKIKLDGTNASIVLFKDGRIQFQSRTTIITPQEDNMGFARWASTVDWSQIFNCTDLPVMIIHGEWAGVGIQKGCAIQNIGIKGFFPFMIEYASDVKNVEWGDWDQRELVVEPYLIEEILLSVKDQVKVLPWYGGEDNQYTIDFGNPDQNVIDQINKLVLEVEAEDPYVKEQFNVSGVGEGLVFYPVGVTDRFEWSHLVFKAKGEKHRVRAAKEAVQTTVDVSASVSEFVSSFVTEARCQQGLMVACGGELDIKKMGAFIGWMGKDVEKESKADLEVSGMTWKQVSGEVTKAARVWFQGQLK